MALNLESCLFLGPALPEPFVAFDLEAELVKAKILPKNAGAEGKELQKRWEVYRRHVRELVNSGGPIRVRNSVIAPLMEFIDYERIDSADLVRTREGDESGGDLIVTADGEHKLRVWTAEFDTDLDAPQKRGLAARFSPVRIAQRVLLTSGERVGLVTNGVELRVLISEPARPDSQVIVKIDPEWKRTRNVPDSFRLIVALCCPKGIQLLPDLIDKARLKQTRVTKDLREQARKAVELFVQGVLDRPDNQERLRSFDKTTLAKQLWREGLVTIYRLLFILKAESSDDPARSFSFAGTSIWRNTYSPTTALARFVEPVLRNGAETGSFLEDGLRRLFDAFAGSRELRCIEMNIKPLGGALFGAQATPLLSELKWGERACASLLDCLLWTQPKRGRTSRERVYYGPLDVEDLGRVYEALLELEPGIAEEPMCRLRRQKLEVVVPLAQGEKYQTSNNGGVEDDDSEMDEEPEEESNGKKTKVLWIEKIDPGRFYLRVGLGRKASGSYYTPHSFVRFLVQETLGPQVAERSPSDEPNPIDILRLKVLDPAMGSGHFLVEACRFLGSALYEACRLCDEKMLAAEKAAEVAAEADNESEFRKAAEEIEKWRQRLLDLPDPSDEILQYLPSHAPEGEEAGYSSKKAEALCRRLVAVHCLYGVDKNPLAVELAKLTLWLESQGEGLPLTFLDHRLVLGDSLTGPFWEKLLYYPGSGQVVEDLFTKDAGIALTSALKDALYHVQRLDTSVGISLAEISEKEAARAELERSLAPFKVLAAAWSGGVMLGPGKCDDMAYTRLLKHIGAAGDLPETLESEALRAMVACGLGVDGIPAGRGEIVSILASGGCVPALSYDLTFPEVFYPTGVPFGRRGFDAVLGNPPWDAITIKRNEWFAGFDFGVLDAATKKERDVIEHKLLADSAVARAFDRYVEEFERTKRVHDALYEYQKVYIDGDLAGRFLDAFRVFMERGSQLLGTGGITGVVVPSAFHANEGATGVRNLYLKQMSLRCCYSFENKMKLFEIHSSFKFAVVVAQRGSLTNSFQCSFYLHDDSWLFDAVSEKGLRYTAELVASTGGAYLNFMELSSSEDLAICETCYSRGRNIGEIWDEEGQHFSTSEINLNLDSKRLVSVSNDRVGDGGLSHTCISQKLSDQTFPLAEGKNLWHYDVFFSRDSRYVIPFPALADRPHWFHTAAFYRLAYRKIASSTNERTLIWAMIPPGPVTSESCPAERGPWLRRNAEALCRQAALNTFTADYLLRLRVAATVSLFMLRLLRYPELSFSPRVLMAHSALRLQCQDVSYQPLWREQLGDEWREKREPFTWPVLQGDDERWEVRAAIDAVVADAYGISREQYEHVLSSFSHKSYPKAPVLCLAKFDELKRIGLEEFTCKYDPYWDIPLVETLPKPVIDLPVPAGKNGKAGQQSLEM